MHSRRTFCLKTFPKTAPFLPKSLYHSRTTSQCVSSCGCAITILYTYVHWLTPHQQGQELHVSWPCHLMDGCPALPNMAGLLMGVKKTKTTASTMSWSSNSPLGPGGLVHHSPNSPLGFGGLVHHSPNSPLGSGGLVPLSLLSTSQLMNIVILILVKWI